MSEPEVRRVEVLNEVQSGKRTVAGAASVLGVSERQAYRLLACYQENGGFGLVHKARGPMSNRSNNPGVRKYAVELVKTHYADFGPTLAINTFNEPLPSILHKAASGQKLRSGHGFRRRRVKQGGQHRRGASGLLISFYPPGPGNCVVFAMAVTTRVVAEHTRIYRDQHSTLTFNRQRKVLIGMGLPYRFYSCEPGESFV